MRNAAFFSAAALIAAIPAAAQEDHFTSSPQGFEYVEGNTSIDLVGKEALLRYQQVDAFTFGSKTNRNRMMWRRDGLLPTNPGMGARNVEIEVLAAESDLGSMSTSFAGNYLAGTDQVVFNRKVVAFPDWSAAPATAPQSQSAALMIYTDVVGWGYPGKATSGTDFLWEIRVYSNDQAGTPYPMDADGGVFTNVPSTGGTAVGPTCFGTGFASGRGANTHVNMRNYGTHMELELDVDDVEAGQNGFVILGGQLQNTPLTSLLGLCGDLEVAPLMTVALGPTNASGFAATTFSNLAYMPSLIGQTIYGQGAGFDTVQGLIMCRTRGVIVPVDPPSGSQLKYMFALDPNAASATSGILDGGIILMTNHT